MLGIPTPNGGGIPGVGGIKPGGGIPYGGNADEKVPAAAGVGAADMVLDEGGPVPDFKKRHYLIEFVFNLIVMYITMAMPWGLLVDKVCVQGQSFVIDKLMFIHNYTSSKRGFLRRTQKPIDV